MSNIEKQLNDVRYKIRAVKENRNNHFRCPINILVVLTRREVELEDQLFQLMAKTDFSF